MGKRGKDRKEGERGRKRREEEERGGGIGKKRGKLSEVSKKFHIFGVFLTRILNLVLLSFIQNQDMKTFLCGFSEIFSRIPKLDVSQ